MHFFGISVISLSAQVFTGCSESRDYKSYVFDPAIVAKKVCINPLTDVDGVVAVRLELYGCELDTGAEDAGTVDVITGTQVSCDV